MWKAFLSRHFFLGCVCVGNVLEGRISVILFSIFDHVAVLGHLACKSDL